MEFMTIENRLAVLSSIYRIYDDFIARQDVACKKYCSTCCTRNVTLTTLEAYLITEYIRTCSENGYYEKIEKESGRQRFQPSVTLNTIVDLCEQGKDLPEEENDCSWGPCPLLENHQCPIYSVRPFGCRCMVSRYHCDTRGYADMDPFVLTVNNVFMQYIEHVDAGGSSGNLTDMLPAMQSENNRRQYLQHGRMTAKAPLISNRPLRHLMVPPEHRTRIRPILELLQNIRVPAD